MSTLHLLLFGAPIVAGLILALVLNYFILGKNRESENYRKIWKVTMIVFVVCGILSFVSLKIFISNTSTSAYSPIGFTKTSDMVKICVTTISASMFLFGTVFALPKFPKSDG